MRCETAAALPQTEMQDATWHVLVTVLRSVVAPTDSTYTVMEEASLQLLLQQRQQRPPLGQISGISSAAIRIVSRPAL